MHKVRPHEYWPDYVAMGDCRICGRVYEDCRRLFGGYEEDACITARKVAWEKLKLLRAVANKRGPRVQDRTRGLVE